MKLKLEDMSITIKSFRVSTFVKFRKEPVGGLLFDMNNWTLFKLNESASQIIPMINGKYNSKDITHDLAKFYNLPNDEMAVNINRYLCQLYRNALIVTSPYNAG